MNFKFIFIFVLTLQMLWAGGSYADSFRLVTYNILSDEYLWDGIYDYVSDDVLSWENRRGKIIERIKELNPDVLCLQELNTASFECFKEALKAYEGSYAKKASSSDDGVGTFCKKYIFKETCHNVVFCDGTSNCGRLATQPALFTTLLFKDGKSILVVNTKIRWSKEIKPGNSASNHVQFILKSISKTGTVVVGDFNMKPDHPLMMDFYSAGLQDGFSHKNTYSCYANKEFQRIDYILSTRDLKSIPFESPFLITAQPIPNENEPSDHLPVGSLIVYE